MGYLLRVFILVAHLVVSTYGQNATVGLSSSSSLSDLRRYRFRKEVKKILPRIDFSDVSYGRKSLDKVGLTSFLYPTRHSMHSASPVALPSTRTSSMPLRELSVVRSSDTDTRSLSLTQNSTRTTSVDGTFLAPTTSLTNGVNALYLKDLNYFTEVRSNTRWNVIINVKIANDNPENGFKMKKTKIFLQYEDENGKTKKADCTSSDSGICSIEVKLKLNKQIYFSGRIVDVTNKKASYDPELDEVDSSIPTIIYPAYTHPPSLSPTVTVIPSALPSALPSISLSSIPSSPPSIGFNAMYLKEFEYNSELLKSGNWRLTLSITVANDNPTGKFKIQKTKTEIIYDAENDKKKKTDCKAGKDGTCVIVLTFKKNKASSTTATITNIINKKAPTYLRNLNEANDTITVQNLASFPSTVPSLVPSTLPTAVPTNFPTTATPTSSPTAIPTTLPTNGPTTISLTGLPSSYSPSSYSPSSYSPSSYSPSSYSPSSYSPSSYSPSSYPPSSYLPSSDWPTYLPSSYPPTYLPSFDPRT